MLLLNLHAQILFCSLPTLTVPFSSHSICPVCHLNTLVMSCFNVQGWGHKTSSFAGYKAKCSEALRGWVSEFWQQCLLVSFPHQLGRVQVHLPDQQLKWLWSVSALLDVGETLRVVLINGHEGFTSHLLLLKLSHDSTSMDCAEVKLELSDVITESVWSFLCRMLSLQCNTAQLFSSKVLSGILDVLMKSAVLINNWQYLFIFLIEVLAVWIWY